MLTVTQVVKEPHFVGQKESSPNLSTGEVLTVTLLFLLLRHGRTAEKILEKLHLQIARCRNG